MAFTVKNKKPLLMTISQNGLRVLGGSLNLWTVFPFSIPYHLIGSRVTSGSF